MSSSSIEPPHQSIYENRLAAAGSARPHAAGSNSHILRQLGQTAGSATGSHISDPIRAALAKHLEQAVAIRRVAGTK